MSKIFIVTKNELFRYFTSPLAYVYLVSFLLLNGSFAFYFGGFFERGQASLDAMFAFQPWLYLIFIPGIAMRLWAEEFRNKTIIQIVTMPISINSLVWGKFLSAWIFCGIALALTFPFWITVNVLGSPDNSVIMVAYLTSFLTAGCILAISSTMSALTKNQVIALVLSFFANILFFLSGLEFILSLIRMIFPISIVDMIASFSFITHFDSMSRGIIELRDIIFFSSILLLFNLTTTLIVSFKTSGTSKLFKSNNKNYYILSFILMLIAFIGINLIANNAFRNVQHDFTQEKLFTLSKSTHKILEKMPDNIIAKLYYSPILGQRNHELRLMFDRMRILLDRYSSVSKGKFTYKIYSPQFLDKSEDEALANGIQPIPVIDINQNAFFGISFSDDLDNKSNIPFFAIERQNLIEEDITQKIYQLFHKKKTVGIIAGIDIGETNVDETSVSQKWEVINQIGKLYNIEFIEKESDFENKSFDVLMIAHPINLSPKTIEFIKDFSINKGKIFLALDAATEASRLFSRTGSKFVPSDLQGLDEFWGFKFHKEFVIADLDSSITVDSTQNYQTTPKFTQDVIQPKLQGDLINRELLETAYLKSILFASASPLTPISEDIFFLPLLKASRNSALMPIDVVYDNISPDKLLRNFQADNYAKYISARIISKDKNNPFDLIVVSDTDFMYDTFWSDSIFMLNNQINIPLLDNANFVMNSLDVLTDNLDLIDLRGKSPEIRKFQGVEKLRINSQKEFSIKEGEILTKIEKTKIGLQEIWGKRGFEGRDIFTPDELALIANARKDLDHLRQELSDVRNNSNYEIKKLETTLKLINIYSVPTLITLFLLVYWLISNRRKDRQKQRMIINKEFLTILAIAVTSLALGILSVYLSDKNEIDKYENKPVFTELEEQINDIETINLTTNKQKLSFYKDEGIWKLKNHEDFPVYQERIRSFLSSLLEATYYEKKSSKAEHLAIFGLQPIEEESSQNIRIEIAGKNNIAISSFEVGKFDIDIGRGSKAAYIKFDNKFQTWLIAVDFIDLSSNWQDWTYSTIWNLRFGRLKDFNNTNNPDSVAELVKEMLNIHLNDIAKNDIKTKVLTNLELVTEDDIVVNIELLENNNEPYIRYKFPSTITNPNLYFFSTYVKNKIYKLDIKDEKKLQNLGELTK